MFQAGGGGRQEHYSFRDSQVAKIMIGTTDVEVTINSFIIERL